MCLRCRSWPLPLLRCRQKSARRRPRFFGNHASSQHPGDLLAAVIVIDAFDAGGNPVGLGGFLGDQEMPLGPCRDLWRVGDRQHLNSAASRASRSPIASATAPPTPVSISSNTRVGADPCPPATLSRRAGTWKVRRQRPLSSSDRVLCRGWSGHEIPAGRCRTCPDCPDRFEFQR